MSLTARGILNVGMFGLGYAMVQDLADQHNEAVAKGRPKKPSSPAAIPSAAAGSSCGSSNVGDCADQRDPG